jgi:uncharacterized membrane protein YraQ (UPF0718 family)
MLETFVLTLLNYLKEIAEVGILGFFVAGLFHAYVRKEAVLRLLGAGGIKSTALASVMGLVTPLCCCSAIPTALSLYRNGSGRGPACAFLIATPWFNFYGLTALSIFLGVPLALLIGLSSVVIAFLTGLLIDRLTPGRRSAPHPLVIQPLTTCGCEESCGDACCGTPPQMGDGWIDFSHHRAKLRAALSFMLDMGREIGLWILAGVVLGALIEALVPETFFTTYLGGPRLLGLLAALVLAAIFYTDSLGSLPWVASLLSKGLGVGSALTLLVAGVGTNISTLGPIARNMGRRTAVLYASSVVILTGLLGLGLNALH